jgi:hypothetical protein
MEKYLRKGNASIFSQFLAASRRETVVKEKGALSGISFSSKVVGRCEVDKVPYTCANYRDKEGKEGRSRDSFILLKLETKSVAGQIQSIHQSESGFVFAVRLFKQLHYNFERQDRFREMTQGRMWLVSSNFEDDVRMISQTDLVRKVGIYPVKRDLWFPGEFLLIIDTDA